MIDWRMTKTNSSILKLRLKVYQETWQKESESLKVDRDNEFLRVSDIRS